MKTDPTATPSYDQIDRLVDEDPLALRDLAWKLLTERDEARADAERMRLVMALAGQGVDPEGNYAGTPGSRVRDLLAVDKAARAYVEAWHGINRYRDGDNLERLADAQRNSRTALVAAVDLLTQEAAPVVGVARAHLAESHRRTIDGVTTHG